MSALLSFLALAIWGKSADAEPIYDIPRVSGISIDGDLSDWKGQGFFVKALSGAEDVPASSCDAQFKLGFTEEGLVVGLEVQDDVFNEDAPISVLYEGDSVEMFLSTNRKEKNQVQILIGPGMTNLQPELRYFLADQRTSPSLRRAPLSAHVARKKVDGGFTLETLIPWTNLGVTPIEGKEFGFQLYINDSDPGKSPKSLRWFPLGDTYSDPSHACRIRLAKRPSSPVVLAGALTYPNFRFSQATAVGPVDLVGQFVDLILKGRKVTSAKMESQNGRAIPRLKGPLPERNSPIKTAVIGLSGRSNRSLVIPDYNAARRVAAEACELNVKDYIFTGSKLPDVELVDAGLMETLVGPHKITVSYFDSAGLAVTSAQTEGRYGAVFKVSPSEGDPISRYVTLYRRPDGPRLSNFKLDLVLPAGLGVSADVALAHQKQSGRWLAQSLFQHSNSLPEAAMLLEGLHESEPGEKIVDRLSPQTRDEHYWYGVRKQLGLERPYQYIAIEPKKSALITDQKWPLIIFLHGSGERGNDLSAVSAVGLPPEVAKRPNFPFLVVAPQCPANEWWQTEKLTDLLADVRRKYQVDDDRIYLTGLSMGGFGSWMWATENPELFAAIAPICGGGDPLDADRLLTIPVWAFHGQDDPTVPIERSREMLRALKLFGHKDARLTEFPGVGHNSWEKGYATDDTTTSTKVDRPVNLRLKFFLKIGNSVFSAKDNVNALNTSWAFSQ